MVMPTKYFKWRSAPSFEILRNEVHRKKLTIDTKYGTPSEQTSTVDLYLLQLLHERKSRLKVTAPLDHQTFESQLQKRVDLADITPDHYTQKVMELALMKTHHQGFSLFKDYNRVSPHSARTAPIKACLSYCSEFNMFPTIAGKRVNVTLVAGLRKFLCISPLVEQEMVFSTSIANEAITVREEVFCGPARFR